MRWTQTLIPTMKETPEGAEIPSHVLMLRAGLVGQLMAGAYSYLPLGLRALKKAERIVREEMDRAGAVELLMPALTPINLWQRTGRVEAFGNVLIQFQVRRQNRQVHLALGPTHEEVVTELVSRHISSYRQLPITLYQIQTKFRNEERPRFGVLRTSEFLMKDAYSFDTSVEGLNASYDKMYQAYCRILRAAGSTIWPSRPKAARSAETPATSSWSWPTTAKTPSSIARLVVTPPTWSGLKSAGGVSPPRARCPSLWPRSTRPRPAALRRSASCSIANQGR